MNRKKISILLFLFHFLTLGFTKEITIPFYINDKGLLLMDFEDNDWKYTFMLDTASTDNTLLQTGYIKLAKSLDIDIETAVIEYVKNENPNLSDIEVRQISLDYINSGALTFSLSELKNADFLSTESSFNYAPSVDSPIDDYQLDGIINLGFFGDTDNIIIDYKHKVLIINSEKKLKNSVAMQKFDVLNLYYINIDIDDIPQQAIIDSGSSLFILREQYKSDSRFLEDDILAVLEQDDLYERHEEQKKKVKLKIGKYQTKLIAVLPDTDNYNATDSAKQIVNMINILGYPVFKNHKIQFDFNNMEFGIE